MKDYILKRKSICDTMATCGRPISEEDQLFSILAGFGSEFEPAIAVLTSRTECYNVQTTIGLLLTSESRALQQSIVPESSMSANLAIQPKKQWHNIIQVIPSIDSGSYGSIN